MCHSGDFGEDLRKNFTEISGTKRRTGCRDHLWILAALRNLSPETFHHDVTDKEGSSLLVFVLEIFGKDPGFSRMNSPESDIVYVTLLDGVCKLS